MAEDSSKEIMYSETRPLPSQETERKSEAEQKVEAELTSLSSPLGLSPQLSKLEEENRYIQDTLAKVMEETTILKEMFNNANKELENLKKPALLVAEIVQVMKDKAVIRLPNANKFFSYIAHQVKNLRSGDTVLVDQKNLNIIGKVEVSSNFDVERFVIINKPKETWEHVGGLSEQIQEIKEVIELPLKNPEVFKKVGIQPPKGLLLHGPPGTGKTLLAKAVAKSTNATFIEVVASELVQKFIGEGAKLVKEIFEYARSNAPSIVFIDEIDALAAIRIENGTTGEREVNRTFMQLLAEMDGFTPLDKVKIIAATNRPDIIDPALLRPGRLDRLLEIGLPDEQGRMEILKVHTQKMNLKKVNLKEVTSQIENFSGAEIKGVCTEAGYFAIRNNREFVTQQDFSDAVEKVRWEDEGDEGEVIHG